MICFYECHFFPPGCGYEGKSCSPGSVYCSTKYLESVQHYIDLLYFCVTNQVPPAYMKECILSLAEGPPLHHPSDKPNPSMISTSMTQSKILSPPVPQPAVHGPTISRPRPCHNPVSRHLPHYRETQLLPTGVQYLHRVY